MEKEKDLITSLIINWKKTGSGYRELIKEASGVIIQYPQKKYNWDYDSCVDFYLDFYPKLTRLINSFEYKGISFNAILRNTIKWQLCSYYRKRQRRGRIDYCLRYHCMIEAEAVADSVSAMPVLHELKLTKKAAELLEIDSAGRVKRKGLRRQLIMLALKSAYFLDDTYMNKIAQLSGCSCEWLSESIRKLRQANIHRRDRYERYNIRISKAYINLCRIHKELENCSLPFEKNQLLLQRDHYSIRLKRAGAARSRVVLSPTNREIAGIMELPKGSVDSGLYFLKKILKDLG